jgi:hypothetical protein
MLTDLKLVRFRTLLLTGGALLVGAAGTWFLSTAQQRRQPAAPPNPDYARIYAEAKKVGLVVPAFESPAAEPKVVTPGAMVGAAPSDAVVLFDGRDLSQWASMRTAGPAEWDVQDGYMQVKRGKGDIVSNFEFGSAQLHVEWATPEVVKGEGQGRGNSGIFLMERYEVQVLDSFENKTYFHGQAGSVYKQHPPLVNPTRKPGEWQAYDIIFTAPEFDAKGMTVKNGRVTVMLNGVLVQNDVEIHGNTWHDRSPYYIAHGPKAGLKLQDHGDPVRFRNIWVRPL